MVQVVTNENIQTLIQTRAVPEFKAPDAKAEPAKEAAPAAAAGADKSAVASDPAEPQRPRAADGKFVKADEAKEPAKADDTAAKAADDDEGDEELTGPIKRKIDKIVAKKHRAMKEAEEFGRDEYNARRAAESRAEALQREIDALKGTKSGSGPASANGASDPDEPKAEDFKTVGEYTRALTKYEVAKAAKEARDTGAKTEQAKVAETRVETFVQRQNAFKEATPDYEEVVGESELDMPNVAMQYLVESEYGPQLAYHFAKNPKDADRLRTLSPGRVLAELGKLEAKYEKQPEPAKPATAATASVSRAPAPITPLEGKTTPVEKDPAKMNFQELRAHRMAERAAGKR